MPDAPAPSPEDLAALSAAGWTLAPDGKAIRKVWAFRGFSDAWGFMTRAALAAEKLNHHPDWANRFNIVDVTLTTHATGGLSTLDVTLARRLDKLAGGAEVRPAPGDARSACENRPRQES